MAPGLTRTKRALLDSALSSESMLRSKRRRCSEDWFRSPLDQPTTSLPTPSPTSAHSSQLDPLDEPSSALFTMTADPPPFSPPPSPLLLHNSRLPSPISRPEPPYNPDFGAYVCARFKVNTQNERFRAKRRQRMRHQKYGRAVADSIEGLETPEEVMRDYEKRQRDAIAEFERYLAEGSSDEEGETGEEAICTGDQGSHSKISPAAPLRNSYGPAATKHLERVPMIAAMSCGVPARMHRSLSTAMT